MIRTISYKFFESTCKTCKKFDTALSHYPDNEVVNIKCNDKTYPYCHIMLGDLLS